MNLSSKVETYTPGNENGSHVFVTSGGRDTILPGRSHTGWPRRGPDDKEYPNRKEVKKEE